MPAVAGYHRIVEEPQLANISEVVQHNLGAAFAVDPDARVVAWNTGIEAGSGLRANEVLGRPCYDVVKAVDQDTGRPCYEQCALVNPAVRAGWVHSRVLRARWMSGQPAKLDCMLVQYVLPSAERGSLSFVTPLSTELAEDGVQRVSALEALSPVLAGPSDLHAATLKALDIVLQATAADIAELSLVELDVPGLPDVSSRSREGQVASMAHPLGRQRMYELVRSYEGALVTCEPDASSCTTWFVTIPLFAEQRLLGMLTVASKQGTFSLASAVRALFVLGSQIGVFLRWAGTRSRRSAGQARGAGALLKLYCFGQFRVFLGDQEVYKSRFRRQKSLVLLKALAARRGKPWHREELMELLWPETDPGLASSNLRVVLHDLRHALEPELPRGRSSTFVVGEGDLIYLDPSEKCWCDVEEFSLQIQAFDAHLAAGDRDQALLAGREACTLYKADFLEDEPYLDWSLEERERIRELYIDLLRRMAVIHVGRDELDEAIAACRLALSADAMREEIHRQLIELLWQARRPDEALRQYESCRKMLLTEFGAEPTERTQRLRERILGQMARSQQGVSPA